MEGVLFATATGAKCTCCVGCAQLPGTLFVAISGATYACSLVGSGAQSVQGDPVNGAFNLTEKGPDVWAVGIGQTFNFYPGTTTCAGTVETPSDAELSVAVTCAGGVLSLLVQYVIPPTYGSTVMALQASVPIANGVTSGLSITGGTLIGGSPVATISW